MNSLFLHLIYSTTMKTILLSLALIYSVNSFSQTTTIPDANFEQALIDLGHDDVIDGGVLTVNISDITYLNVSSNSITDLSGIEDFTALTILTCYSNPLTSLDVSQNTALTNLDCGLSLLTSLDVSQNTALTDLACHYNQLTSLDVSQNTTLTTLQCHYNQLTGLDVSQNTALTYLSCGISQLTSLDVSQNTALTILDCSLSQLTSLDVSQNTALTTLYCNDNNLNCLNLKNGNYANVLNLDTRNNPNLTCIEVDDVAYSTTNWTSIPPLASFSTDCDNTCSVGITELTNSPKQLLKIVDLMGRETEFKTNTPLIYIYSDGSSETVFEVGN